MEISWRSVDLEDAEDLFLWRNSDSGRQYSGNSAEIPLSHHLEWFQSRLFRVATEPFYMFISKEYKVGMCRFDRDVENKKSFEISVLVNPNFQGAGVGTQILVASCQQVFEKFPGVKITARVHRENRKSLNLFANFGFVTTSADETFLILEKT